MYRLGRALVWHEFLERVRDRWVLAISVVFAGLATAVGAYGRAAGGESSNLTGPSLVTLASLLVPLVGLVLSHDAIVGERERNTLPLLLSLPGGRFEIVLGKFLGRGLALTLAVVAGLLAAQLMSGAGAEQVFLALVVPSLLLGLAFLSIGFLISAPAKRQSSAISQVVVVWFALVFFYDLGILALLVGTDGALSQGAVTALIAANPAGLYRMTMMDALAGPDALEAIGVVTALPGAAWRAVLWAGWLVGPLIVSGLVLARRRFV